MIRMSDSCKGLISLSTVKTHLANVQTKLDLRNRVEIAAWAWRHGIV
jgi:DNA-binding CsgD family transcriptional regulator